MMSFKAEKSLILQYYAELDAGKSDPHAVLNRYVTSDYLWRGFHPFAEQDTLGAAQNFWQPLQESLTSIQRRLDVFFAGQNSLDGAEGIWVVSMGHLVGLFDQPWLGIPATGKMAFLRYAEFHRVLDGKIAESAMYFDIPHLMIQVGFQPFKSQTAAHMVQPGPMTHDGLLYNDAPMQEGQKTLQTINAMISDLGQWQSGLPLEDELRRTWHEDMIWWGPAGIGATYTIPRYAQQHAAPFRAGFANRTGTGHIARLAEGHYGGFFGWPNFTAQPVGGFMGLPTFDKPVEFRVIDLYRRDGDKLAENWIFIDILYFLYQQNIDVLAGFNNAHD